MQAAGEHCKDVHSCAPCYWTPAKQGNGLHITQRHVGRAAVRSSDLLSGVTQAEGPGDRPGQDHRGHHSGHWGWGQ